MEKEGFIMKLVKVTEALTINIDYIVQILAISHNTKASKSSHTYSTIQATVNQAKKHYRYFDYTNERDGIKTIIILTNGDVCGTSLTSEKLIPILTGKSKPKTRAGKYDML